MLVDDNEDTLYIIGRVLKKSSFEIIECRDGLETLEKVKTCKPDLILLDIVMPKTDGFEICAHLKADPHTKDIPIIIHSATLSDISSKIRGLNVGANDYLTFPMNFNELLARINVQFRIKTLEAELRESERLNALNETVWTLHHEINNPLAVILGWAQLLLKKHSLGKEIIDALNKIEVSALKIEEVVKKLTNITRCVKTTSYNGGHNMIDVDSSE